MASIDCIDHAVINVKYGMDEAASLFSGLGFSLTPRGFHSHGSLNHLMIFGNDYLELIGVPEGKTIERQDLINAPIGVNGIVFKSNNINKSFTKIKKIGFSGMPPKTLSRSIDIDGKQKTARFQTVTVRNGVFPGGRVYYCQHDTPELVWRPEWQTHPNGVTGILGLTTVTYNTNLEAERFATLLNSEVKTNDVSSCCITLNNFHLTILDPDEYAVRYGKLASRMKARSSIFGAIIFTTDALPTLNKLLYNLDGIITDYCPNRTIVYLEAYNTLLEFRCAKPV